MRITREEALQILKYQKGNPNAFFPFIVVNQKYTPEDDDFVEIVPEDDLENIFEDKNYKTFELWNKNPIGDEGTRDEIKREFLRFIEEQKITPPQEKIKKIAVFDYSCGKIFGIDLSKESDSEEVEEILFDKYDFSDSQIYWMEVEDFKIEIL